MNKILLTFLIINLLPKTLQAQQTACKSLNGKVTADANDLAEIYVLNLKTQIATKTQDGGYFSINAQVGDTIMLSSIHFKAKRIGVSKEDLDKELLFIKLQPIMHQLEEVTVFQYKNINAVALGIIPKGTKSYTPAERKLRTATGLDAQIGLNTSVTLDPLFNMLSGRTAMLKKELIVETKETNMQRIENMFEKEYFIEKLKIPEEYVKGFRFYLVENDRFVSVLNSKNKAMATFMMGELAVKYLDIIACEKN